jgi:carbon storage regulator
MRGFCQELPLHWTGSLDYIASQFGGIRNRPTSFHSRIAKEPDPRPSSGLPDLENESRDRTAACFGVDCHGGMAMLVLSRKRDSSIHIGADIRVTILGIRGNQVKVGVEAPAAIPVWRDEVLPNGRPSLELQAREDGRSSGKKPFEVLLVEDDLGHAKLICGAFSECRLPRPIDVAVAQTGELAAESLGMDGGQRPAAPPFDLILLDFYLPRMTGLDFLLRIRTDPLLYLTPVVIFSCADDDAVAANCLDAGANAFVSKSRDPGAFRTSIARIADFWGNECRFPRLHVWRPLASEIAR